MYQDQIFKTVYMYEVGLFYLCGGVWGMWGGVCVGVCVRCVGGGMDMCVCD